MPKRMLCALLLVSLFCLCSGFSSCRGPQYTADELKDTAAEGKKQMQRWLDEHMPGAQVNTASVNIEMIPSGPHYLTDFVSGSFTHDGRTESYLIDTASGAVYLEGNKALFLAACRDYVLNALALAKWEESCTLNGFDAGISFRQDWTMNEAEEELPELMLPGELILRHPDDALMREYVETPEKRDIIRITGEAQVPDELALEELDMAWFDRLEKDSGLHFDSFSLADSTESVSVYSRFVSFERYGFASVESPDIRIRMKEKYRVEENRRGKISVSEEHESRLSDLTFEKTQQGWLISFRDRESIFDFTIHAAPGSSFLQQEYRCLDDRLAYLSPGSQISGDRYVEKTLYWKRISADDFVLADENGIPVSFFGGEELIPRS